MENSSPSAFAIQLQKVAAGTCIGHLVKLVMPGWRRFLGDRLTGGITLQKLFQNLPTS